MYLESFIGRRYLKANKRYAFISLITFLSTAGVTVGVMALIVVIAVMSGFDEDLKTRILGVESHIVITKGKKGIINYKAVSQKIEQVANVTHVCPFISTQVMLKSFGRVAGANIEGIDPENTDKIIRNHKALDKLAALSTRKDPSSDNIPGIILGKELARSLGVFENEVIYMISPKGMLSPIGFMPLMKKFKVVGVFATGIYEFDGSMAYIGLDAAQSIMKMGSRITGMEVSVSDLYHVKKTSKLIRKRIGSAYKIQDWMDKNKNLFFALKLEKTVMFIILTLIILVAALNIAGSLAMTVMEKTKDIAILKAMGATNAMVKKIFMIKGLFIGLSGTIFGLFSGLLICEILKRYNFLRLPESIYYITTIPVKLEIPYLVAICLVSIFLCLAATIYPSNQAARLDPIDAIRYG